GRVAGSAGSPDEIGESPLERHCALEATCTCRPPGGPGFCVTYGIALIGRHRWADRIRSEELVRWSYDDARTGFWRSLFRCQGAARGTRRPMTDSPRPDLTPVPTPRTAPPPPPVSVPTDS